MYVRCQDGEVQLVEVDDLKRLHVEVDGSVADGVLGAFGSLEGEDAWLSVQALRDGAHAQGVAPRWDEDFDAMVEFAAEHGWASPDGRSVRAHVVRAG